jgi:hypothetical protein
MKLVGFNISKISAEKAEKLEGSLNIKTNINLGEVSKLDSGLINSKDDLITIGFEYNINYEPNFAKVSFKGSVLFAFNQSDSKNLIKEWEKNKTIPENFRTPIFNAIFKKSNLKALQLEEDIGLPLHVPMPFIKSESPENS